MNQALDATNDNGTDHDHEDAPDVRDLMEDDEDENDEDWPGEDDPPLTVSVG
jgi:hypothetical protein